jgi:hypothetical protein
MNLVTAWMLWWRNVDLLVPAGTNTLLNWIQCGFNVGFSHSPLWTRSWKRWLDRFESRKTWQVFTTLKSLNKVNILMEHSFNTILDSQLCCNNVICQRCKMVVKFICVFVYSLLFNVTCSESDFQVNLVVWVGVEMFHSLFIIRLTNWLINIPVGFLHTGRMVRTSDSQPKGHGFRILAKARRGICEQDTLKSTARGSQNKQCLQHVPLTSVPVKEEREKKIDFQKLVLCKILCKSTFLKSTSPF